MNNNVSVKFSKTGKFAVDLHSNIEVEEDEVVNDLPPDFGVWCEQEKVGEMVEPEEVEEDEDLLEQERLEEERLEKEQEEKRVAEEEVERDKAEEEKRLEQERLNKEKEEEELENKDKDKDKDEAETIPPPISDKKKAVKAGPKSKKISKSKPPKKTS